MNPVEELLDGDTVGFRDSVHDILMGKLADRLDIERMNVASTLFEPDDFEDEEEGSEEEDV